MRPQSDKTAGQRVPWKPSGLFFVVFALLRALPQSKYRTSQNLRPFGKIRGNQGTLGTNWAQNFGSLRRLKSGRIQARYTGLDGVRYNAPTTFPDELSAYGWLAEVRRSIDLGTWQPPESRPEPTVPTVGDMVRHWLEQTRIAVNTGEMRLTSLQTYTDIANARILNYPQLCNTAVNELTAQDVALWWGEIQRTYPATRDRNKRAYSKLKASLDYAVEYGYTQYNPVQLKAAKRQPRRKNKQLPTTRTLRAILDAAPEHYKLGVCLCLFHGVRIGEMLALKGCNVIDDESGLAFSIETTMARITENGKTRMVEMPSPKTVAGYRTVPVLAEFRPMIRDYLRNRNAGDGEYLTLTARGGVVMDTSFREAFKRAVRRAGAPTEITPHYGRNWLITRLAESGATPTEIGRVLGQEDLSTIVQVYMKVRETRPAELMENLEY